MTCTHCQAQTADGIYLCDPHEGDLFTLLGVIPDTLADAQDTVARLDTKRGTGRGRPSTAPANLEAMQRVTELGDLLVSWSRLVYEVTGESGDAGSDYLRRNLRAITGHDWAGDMLGELDKAHRRVVACVDVPPDPVALGICEVETEGGKCGGSIVGTLETTIDESGRAHKKPSRFARCRGCRAVYDGRETYAHQASKAWSVWVPFPEALSMIRSIPNMPSRATLYRWSESGLFMRTGKGGELYCPAQMVAASMSKLGLE